MTTKLLEYVALLINYLNDIRVRGFDTDGNYPFYITTK